MLVKGAPEVGLLLYFPSIIKTQITWCISHSYITVSQQLNCGDIYQIWMFFKGFNFQFCKTKIYPNRKTLTLLLYIAMDLEISIYTGSDSWCHSINVFCILNVPPTIVKYVYSKHWQLYILQCCFIEFIHYLCIRYIFELFYEINDSEFDLSYNLHIHP